MDMFFGAVKAFFDTFSAVVFVPMIMFVINLAFKVKPKKAFISALSAGVGLQGFNLVIGAYGPIIEPIITRMVETSGVNLPVYDAGWPNTSVVAYSTQAGMVFVVIAILLQVGLFLSRYTTVFQAGDLWNNYSYFCWGSMLYVLTGNMFLAICLMTMQLLITLLITEVIAKRWSTYYGYPGCSIASLHTATVAVIAIPLNWLLNKMGLYKIQMDPNGMRKKLGIIGEPMTLGLILGILIGFVGNITRITQLAAWGEILSCGVATSAVMSVFPKISSIFSGAFTALTEASKKKTKGFKGEWYLAVNDATGYGETATLVSGLLTMPIILLLAFVLPGNTTLPMVDLVAIPYVIQPIVAINVQRQRGEIRHRFHHCMYHLPVYLLRLRQHIYGGCEGGRRLPGFRRRNDGYVLYYHRTAHRLPDLPDIRQPKSDPNRASCGGLRGFLRADPQEQREDLRGSGESGSESRRDCICCTIGITA
ncbi:PTS transporter subunit IIC [Enterocloster lavalensis]|uniref:PTS transporter subunit IIC n=1 Tax=Enterocloster lavalensis TaxID=460384 RepID=UPI0034A325CE